MSCQLWRDLKRTGPNPREDVLHNLFRWEESAHVSRGARLCRRLKTIRWRWLDVWTLQQSQRISSEALQPETNTSTLLGTEQTRSLQQVGWQYAICWLSHTFDIAGPKKKKKAREKTFHAAVPGLLTTELANGDVYPETNHRPPHTSLHRSFTVRKAQMFLSFSRSRFLHCHQHYPELLLRMCAVIFRSGWF